MVPDGFSPHFRNSPLTDPWEPIYSKRTDHSIILGLLASSQHCNSRGFVHGGLISTLADNAMVLSCAFQHKPVTPVVTVDLKLNFIKAAQTGHWLQFDTQTVKTGRTLDFAQGQVFAGGKICALMSATFKVIETRK